ncbi:Nucleolar complex protein, partial [Nymphaea thermarum]
DPEFYKFLEDHDKELLEFEDEEPSEDTDVDEAELEPFLPTESTQKSGKVLTTAMIDSWCKNISENGSVGAIRSIMRAFQTACHYGDDNKNESSRKFSVMTSSVFNKIMVFVLNKIDGIFRTFLKLPETGGKKETIVELMTTKAWKDHGYLVKSYLGNTLHVLQQMTDTEMISFTLQRLRSSAVFLAAFPSLLRRYIKVSLHFWGTGKGALPVVSFLLMRDCCIRLGSDCIDPCLKGIYKAYVVNCQFVTPTKLQHIEFLGSCIIELYGVDLPSAYQHAFVFIRQLGMILRDAITVQTKDAYRKVYEWKYLNCLQLWTRVVCTYKEDPDFRLLAYPLTQIICGAAQLVPTARYFPLRLKCTRMLNQIAISTGTFIPIGSLLADMLEFKELKKSATGGVGKAVNFRSTLKVSKQTLRTRAFQEECVFSVIEQIGEHLEQWSYSVFFYELAFIPLTRLRSFCKTTTIERFRREAKQLVQQVEANVEFTNKMRTTIAFSPNDQAEIASFLEVEKKAKLSPLSLYMENLHLRARQRKASMDESSVLVGEKVSRFTKEIPDIESEDAEHGNAVFSSNWLPGNDAKKSLKSKKHTKKRKWEDQEPVMDEDVVTELELSSDEDERSGSPVLEGHFGSPTGTQKSQQKTSKRKDTKKMKRAKKPPKNKNKRAPLK